MFLRQLKTRDEGIIPRNEKNQKNMLFGTIVNFKLFNFKDLIKKKQLIF